MPQNLVQAQQNVELALLTLAAYRDGRIDGDALDSALGSIAWMDSLALILGDKPDLAEEKLDEYVQLFADEGYTCYDSWGKSLKGRKTCPDCDECVHAGFDDEGKCVHCRFSHIGCSCADKCKCINCDPNSKTSQDWCYALGRDIDENGEAIE